MEGAKMRIPLFITFLFICIFITLSAAPAFSAAQGGLITVEAEGFAEVVDGNINEARERAERSAYRDALEKAMGAFVTGITKMQNYQVVSDKVFSQTTGIVKKFEIIGEKVGDDGILVITARCQVGEAALDGVLGPAVINAMGHPRVMVLIDERIEDTIPFLSTTESEVMRIFEMAGFLLVDSTQADILKNIDLNEIRTRDDPEAFRQLARDFQADVLIYGKAYGSSFANQRISGVRIYGIRSTVQLKAVMANNAYQLGSQTYEEKTKGVSVEDGAIKGLKPAASKASKSMVNKIAYALASSGSSRMPVKIKIANISFNDLRKLMETLRGVDEAEVYQRLFRDNVGEIDVVSNMTAEDLAGLLADNGCEITDLSSAVIEVGGILK